jgi:hypothetical protein
MKCTSFLLMYFAAVTELAAAPRAELEPNENNGEAMAVTAGDTVVGMVHFGDNKDTFKLSFPHTGKATITLSGFAEDAAFQIGSAGFQEWDTSPARWTEGKPGETVTHTFDVLAGKPGYIWVALTSRRRTISAGPWGAVRCSDDGPWYTTPPMTGKPPVAPATYQGAPVHDPITYTLLLGPQGAGRAGAAGNSKMFRAEDVPLTFRYPAAWSDVRPVHGGHELTSGANVSVQLFRVMKSDHPESSGWSQVMLAQDQLVQQGGKVVRINSRQLAAREVPYALVAFTVPMSDSRHLVINVAQFIIEHGDAYYWLSFKASATAWEREAPQFQQILETLRLEEP